MTTSPAAQKIDALLDVMARLRAPEGGCPWDIEQDFGTIAPYTVEEAYEVADAIERKDMPALKDELGDLLFQTVFHAQMAREEGLFDFGDVADAITDKMIRRHPHVFADAEFRSADEQTDAWEIQKAEERAGKGEDSLLADVPIGLPGLTRAVKLQKRAGRVGFDWKDATDVLDKITEETHELRDAMQSGNQKEIEADEIFLTGTAAEVTPVRSVDDLVVGNGERPVTSKIQEMFFGLFNGETEDEWGWLDPVA